MERGRGHILLRNDIGQEVAVRLYADEVKPSQPSPADGQRWLYIGVLAIPEDLHDFALSLLVDGRREVGYDGEVHFAGLTQHHKIRLAQRWLQLVLNDNRKCFHFHILGLNLSKLQREAFGETRREQDRRIYNRFFRSAVALVLKGFFLGEASVNTVRVAAVYHDRTEMEHDDLFDWHTIWRLERDEPSIVFDVRQIHFIDSDHRREARFPSESHFIQLIDVVLGATRQCLDYTSDKPGLVQTAEVLVPLLERLTDPRRASNPNSRYRYFRRCSVGFFPSTALSPDQLTTPERLRSRMYVERPLHMVRVRSGQQSLDFTV